MNKSDNVMGGQAYIDENNAMRTYKDGEPCELNCERHVTRPCERCGRIMAQGEIKLHEFNS